MTSKVYKVTPVLKVCERSIDQGGGAYLYFEENLGIPGVDEYSIRLEFKNANSIDKMQDIKNYLQEKGLMLSFCKN